MDVRNSISQAIADGRYLKLDCTNDPLTNDLDMGDNNLNNCPVIYGGDSISDNLELRPNTVAPPVQAGATDGRCLVYGGITFLGFDDMSAGASATQGAIMKSNETSDCTGSAFVLFGGFTYTNIIQYNTAQTFGGSAVFQDASTWAETSAPGAHANFSLSSFLGGPKYRVDHSGVGVPPTEVSAFNAGTSTDKYNGSALTMGRMIGFQTNGIFALKVFLGTEELRGGVVCTNYMHFLANSDIAGGLTLHGGSSIVNEYGLKLENIDHGTNVWSIWSDSVNAVLYHKADIQVATDDKSVIWGTGQDAGISYDGTDLVVNSSLQGSGTVKLTSPNNWTNNGAQTVTITNVAPAGVGTATISRWLTVKDNTGTVYYIPAWT